MKNLRLLVVLFIILPMAGYGQLKKDVSKPNISNTLNSATYANGLLGFLPPVDAAQFFDVLYVFRRWRDDGQYIYEYA